MLEHHGQATSPQHRGPARLFRQRLLQGLTKHPRLDVIRQLDLPSGDFAIFGSGPLYVRGIIDAVSDIDVICRGAAWQKIQTIGELRYLDRYDVEVVELHDGQLSFGTHWGIGDFDIDELIDTAEQIDGLPFVRLEYVAEYKRLASREKDLAHLAALDRWIASTS